MIDWISGGPSGRRPVSFPLLLIACLFSFPWCLNPPVLLAQEAAEGEPRETFAGETTTLMVEVPVEVTLDGQPMRGLTADNFELTDSGDPQEILSVDVVDLSQIEVSAVGGRKSDALPVVARRHFLLLFDFSFSDPASVVRARRAAIDLVENDLHPADLVAVANYSLNRGVEVQLAFTPDRQQARFALGALQQSESTQTRSDPLKLFVAEPGREIDGDIGTRRGSGDLRGQEDGTFRQLQAMADRSQATQGRREISAMARSLGELGALLRSVDGRKHVVFFSEGFDGDLLIGTTDQNRRDQLSRQAQRTGSIVDFATIDSAEYFGSTETVNVMEEMTEEFRRSDSTVHTVDIGGLRDGQGGTGGAKDGLFMVARGTGGSFYESFNDLGRVMEQMLEKTSVTYVLSYQPEKLEHDGKYRKLKVKLKNLPRKAEIVHRPGYFAPDADAPVEQGLSAQLDLAQKLWDGEEGGTIDARLMAVPLRTEHQRLGGDAYVPLVMEIDGPSLLAETRRPSAEPKKKKRRRGKAPKPKAEGPPRAEIFLYALDERGKVADFFSQSIALDERVSGAALKERGLKVYAPMLLEEGEYVLRLLVRNSRTGATGLRIGRVSVPAAEEEQPRLLAPLFPESSDAWVMVRGRRQDVDSAGEPPYPFVHGSMVYAPSVRPQLKAGQILPVFLAGYEIVGAVDLQSEVLDEWGRSVASPRWRLDDRMQQGDQGLQRYAAAIEVPPLDPGTYTLEVRLGNKDGVESSIGAVDFDMLFPSDVARSRLLTLDSPPDFGPRSSKGDSESETVVSSRMDAPGLAEREAVQEDLMPTAEIRSRYRNVLSRLASSGGSEAKLQELVTDIASVERAAVGPSPERRRIARLARIEARMAAELAAGDPEALVPMVLLHHDLFLHHKEMRRPLLAHHSRSMVEELAGKYARLAGSEGARVMAARALASLGGYLEAAGRQAGLGLFEQSLLLDGTNEAALLGLAAFHEKRGGPYSEAVRYLEQLVGNRPESREGRLRLALNLKRVAEESGTVGRGAQAEAAAEHLKTLLEGPESDWIYSIAAQELARFHASRGFVDTAIEGLETALKRLPEEQKLHLQLAYYLDRDRRGGAAGHRASLVVNSLAGEAMASRGLYNEWPTSALDRDRRALREGAAQRLFVLSQLDPETSSATSDADGSSR